MVNKNSSFKEPSDILVNWTNPDRTPISLQEVVSKLDKGFRPEFAVQALIVAQDIIQRKVSGIEIGHGYSLLKKSIEADPTLISTDMTNRLAAVRDNSTRNLEERQQAVKLLAKVEKLSPSTPIPAPPRYIEPGCVDDFLKASKELLKPLAIAGVSAMAIIAACSYAAAVKTIAPSAAPINFTQNTAGYAASSSLGIIIGAGIRYRRKRLDQQSLTP